MSRWTKFLCSLRVWVLVALLGLPALQPVQAYLTDTNSHPVADDGGTYDRDTWNPTNGSFPGVASSYTDPVFSEVITRVTAGYSGTGTALSMQHQWNANGTRYFYMDTSGNVNILTVSTGATYRADVPPDGFPGTKNVQWDPENSDVYWFTDGNLLKKADTTTDPVTVTTEKDFGTALGAMGTTGDWVVRPVGEGSADNRIFLLQMSVSGTQVLRVWQSEPDTFYDGTFAVSSGGGTNNWSGFSPQGDYIIRAITESGTPKFYSIAVNKDTEDVGNSTANQTGKLFWNNMCFDHAGIVTVPGGGTYVITGACLLERWTYRVSVDNDVTGLTQSQQAAASGNTRLFQTDASGQTGNSHFSCATNDDAGMGEYCWVSTEDLNETAGSPGTWYAHKQEILLVDMATPAVKRMAHHRSYPQSGHFCGQARVNAARDGSQAVFTSGFGLVGTGCGYSDLYHIDAP